MTHNQDPNDLINFNMLNIGDFYQQLSNHSSRLNSKSSSNDNSDYIFNSISSPTKSPINDPQVSSPESTKTSSHQTAVFRQRIPISNSFSNNLAAPNFQVEHQQTFPEAEENNQNTKLFVGNLPTSTTLPELLTVFRKHGPVNEKLSVVKDRNYAFIHFYNRKDAQLAMEEVNDSLFKDRYIRVQFSTSKNYTSNNKNRTVDKKVFHHDFNNNEANKQVCQSFSQSSSCLFQNHQPHQPHVPHSNQSNYRPITGKSSTQQQPNNFNSNQFSRAPNDFQQNQLMQYLLEKLQQPRELDQLKQLQVQLQLQQQQQQQRQQHNHQMQHQQRISRSTTIEDFNLQNHTDTHINFPGQASSLSNQGNTIQNLNRDTLLNMQPQQSGIIARSNTMFSFPNNFNVNR